VDVRLLAALMITLMLGLLSLSLSISRRLRS
jgi:hypothetical protein